MRISDWSSDVCSSDLIGVAADQAVVLASRVWRDHLADAESASETTHVAGRNRGARARIGRTIERDTLRSEEILHRGRTHRTVVTATNTDVPRRGQFTFDLVGIGRSTGAIVRIKVRSEEH